MHPVEPALGGQCLDVPPGGDGGDPEQPGQVGDTGRAALAHQAQKSGVSFGSTLAHGAVSP
ncbi:pyruvate carboxyltransferase [Streptomyces laurentii]|uniref:Pyruvate carboxyltransferase n=1 Tax=Streptomyces laurentii TaxID=39478 RepID=A0A160P4H5_STRLU|nr:pyruvate carboxyltransferase [Streptomyces laurentii]